MGVSIVLLGALLAVGLASCGSSLRESDVVGTYEITSMQTASSALTDAQLNTLNTRNFELIMAEDHHYCLGANGIVRFYGSWELSKGTVMMVNNDESITAEWEDGTMTLTSGKTTMSFTKTKDTAQLPATLASQLGVSDK